MSRFQLRRLLGPSLMVFAAFVPGCDSTADVGKSPDIAIPDSGSPDGLAGFRCAQAEPKCPDGYVCNGGYCVLRSDGGVCTPQLDDRQEQSESALAHLGCGWLVAQPFAPKVAGRLAAIEALIKSIEIPSSESCYSASGKTGDIVAEVYRTLADTMVSGAAIATAKVPADQALGAAKMVRFEFAQSPAVVVGATYFVVISYDSTKYEGKWYGLLSESFLHKQHLYRTATESSWRDEAKQCAGAQYCLYLRFSTFVCPNS